MTRLRPLLIVTAISLAALSLAQDRLAGMIDISERLAKKKEIQSAINAPRPSIRWIDDKNFGIQLESKWYSVNAETGERTELETAPPRPPRAARTEHPNAKRKRPARGRQYTEEFSADATLRAFYEDGNLYIEGADGSNRLAVTTEGDASKRIKYGSASWVYGEELGQRTAMGWSPDGKKIWFYRFDDSMVKDYFIALSQTNIQTILDTEAYPKAGTANPECDLFVFDLETNKQTQIAVRPGEFNEGVGHYVYSINWSPDGKDLLFHRTNRWQNTMEFCAANPATGDVRVIVREERPTGWTTNRPQRQYLDQHPDIDSAPEYKNKMIWRSSRNGFQNYFLVDLKTGQASKITNNNVDAFNILRVDLINDEIYYMAAGEINPYKQQLHRSTLNGRETEVLTWPQFHHTISLAPAGRFFIDTFESINQPPTTMIFGDGRVAGQVLLQGDIERAVKLGFRPTERIEFKAADGVTDLYGTLQFPADFDPSKKYPVIINIYAGPESNGHNERFQMFDRKTDYGFIVARFAVRGNSGRGHDFLDAAYMKLGVTEIDDHAEGVKAIGKLPYVDSQRIGITGTSYGGYSSTMCLLRFPDLFHAAVASSSVTKWHHYDTIYTERYMRTPQTNKEGYDAGSAMTYAKNLKGWLMLYYGTSDNNVHQSNSHELIKALQRAGKYFEVQVGPDQGHTGLNFNRTMEFFIERLIMTPPRQG